MKKNLSIITLFFSFIFSSVFFVPEKAEAGLPVLDYTMIAKEFGLDTAATTVTQRLFKKMVNDTVNWSLGGFDGEPSFINNWSDFLRDTAHQELNSSFQRALSSAKTQMKKNQKNDGGEKISAYEACMRDLNTDSRFANWINNPELKMPSETKKAYQEGQNECKKKQEKEVKRKKREAKREAARAERAKKREERCLKKLNESDTYRKYIAEKKEMPKEVKSNYDKAKAACKESSKGSSVDWKGAGKRSAEDIYRLYKSGDVMNARNIARIIAREGSKALGPAELNQILAGKGYTLDKVLGPDVSPQEYSSNFNKGGWAAYAALADPHNNPSGLNSLVVGSLKKKTSQKINTTIEDVTNPKKFLAKKKCEGGYDKDGNCKGKELTVTPASQVEDLANNAQKSEFEMAKLGKELSDVLAQAVGRMVEGLTQKGLSSLSKSGSGSNKNPAEIAAAQFKSKYQNDYDVLGINDDDDTEDSPGISISDSSSPSVVDTSSPEFKKAIGSDGSTPYIGGPEDIEGVAWNEGPEYVVNLREKLEPAIDITTSYLQGYIAMQIAIRKSQSLISNLDKCAPGPDYKWQDRFRDSFDMTNDENSIAFREMKNMVSDSQVNIPGAKFIYSTIDQILGGANQEIDNNESYITKARSSLSSLEGIRDDILASFESIKSTVDSRLPLFIYEWDSLGEKDKLDLLKLPQMAGYINFEEKTDNFIQQKLQEKPKALRDAVISYSWNLWRDEMGKTKEGKEKKAEFRYRYFVKKNDVPTQSQVLESETQLKEINGRTRLAEDLLRDCHVFRLYALGAKESSLGSATKDLAKVKEFYAGSMQLKHAARYRSSTGLVFFLDASKGRTDNEIKTFLENQYTKKQKGQKSYFRTNYFISPSAISQSILKFKSKSDKDKYFDGLYGDTEETDHVRGNNFGILPNAKTIVEILFRDKMLIAYRKSKGVRGTLFCRVSGSFEGNSHGRLKTQDPVHNCYRDWYVASDLDYKAAIAGL